MFPIWEKSLNEGEKITNIVLKANLFPMRLSMRDKRAGELTVSVENRDETSKLLKLDIQLPDAVSFDKSGINRLVQKRLDVVKASEVKEFRFPVFVTQHASPGIHSGKAIVGEHASNYDYETSRTAKELSFRIID